MRFRRLDLSEPPRPITGRWGSWVLDWDRLTLTHERHNYELDLARFDTAAAMLNMIVQVRTKQFMTALDVGELVVALDDVFGIQGSLTPGGVSRRIKNVPEYLARRRLAVAKA